MLLWDEPGLCIILAVVTPDNAAADVDAPLVEWAEKHDMSIPLICSISLSHLAIDDKVTALCGAVMARRSCDCCFLHV